MTKTPAQENEPNEQVEPIAAYPPEEHETPDGLVEATDAEDEESFEVPLGPEGDRTFM